MWGQLTVVVVVDVVVVVEVVVFVVVVVVDVLVLVAGLVGVATAVDEFSMATSITKVSFVAIVGAPLAAPNCRTTNDKATNTFAKGNHQHSLQPFHMVFGKTKALQGLWISNLEKHF